MRLSFYDYSYGNQELAGSTVQKDLEVVFDYRLGFSNHLDMIRAKSYRLLGFIYRVTRELNVRTLLHLYRTIVLPILTYAYPIIWSPYEETDCQILEGVQHILLRMLSYKSGEPMHFSDHEYSPMASEFDLPRL